MKRIAIEDVVNCRFDAGGTPLVCTLSALARLDGDKRKTLVKLDGGGPLVLSPDRTLAFVGDGKKVRAIDLAKPKTALATMSATGDGPMGIAMSPDRTRVLVGGNDEGGILKLYEFGKARAKYTIGSVRYAKVAWLDDARFVTASTEWNTSIQIHDAAKGAVIEKLGDPHPKSTRKPDKPGPSSRDLVIAGETLWFASEYGLARIEAGEPTWVRDQPVTALAVAGERVFAAHGDGTVRCDGETVATYEGEAFDLDVTPDGKHLAITVENAVYLT